METLVPGCTRDCGCFVKAQLGRRGLGTARGRERGKAAVPARPSQVAAAAAAAAAADAATTAVAGTRFVFVGPEFAARALRVRRYVELGRLGLSASGLAQPGAGAAAGNYEETGRLLVTSSVVLRGGHAVAEDQLASPRTVWAPHKTCRSSHLLVRLSSG